MKIDSRNLLSFAAVFHRMSRSLTVSATSLSSATMSTTNYIPHEHAFNPKSSQDHLSLPEHMKLKKVVIFTRHGDRSQISRTVGDNYPENDKWTQIWKSKLPSTTTALKLHQTARILDLKLDASDVDDDESLADVVDSYSSANELNTDKVSKIYAGWDSVNSPYGMLTELGSQQLQNLGKSMRTRYFDVLVQNKTDEFSSNIYCRSTNMCRTLLSLRSFLTGFLQTESSESTKTLPLVVRRHKHKETLYPQADGPCHSVSKRREVLLSDNFVSKSLSDYDSFEQKIKRILGFQRGPVNWLTVKEVLTCHTVHEIPLPADITDEDVDKATVIAATMWGRLYNDKELNRLAIGRFIRELLHDMGDSSAVGDPTPASPMNTNSLKHPHENSRQEMAPHANVLIYSGHDSTLVPLLCAVGLYKNEWTPYASYLAFEIAESSDPAHCASTQPANSDTCSSGGNASANSKLWVRLIFNDEVQVPTKIIEEFGPFSLHGHGAAPSNDGTQSDGKTTGSSSLDAINDTWIPYDIFHSYLQSFAVSEEEYKLACADPLSDSSAASQQMQDEIRATIGTVSKKTRVN